MLSATAVPTMATRQTVAVKPATTTVVAAMKVQETAATCKAGELVRTFTFCATPPTLEVPASGECPAGYEKGLLDPSKPILALYTCRRKFTAATVASLPYNMCLPGGVGDPRPCNEQELALYWAAAQPAYEAPPAMAYPPGTITAFDPAIGMWRVAKPLSGLWGACMFGGCEVGQAAGYQELPPVATKPAGAQEVPLEDLKRTTAGGLVPGQVTDEHGCFTALGQRWCADAGKCITPAAGEKCEPPPIYKKWWFWALIAGGTVGLGTTGYFLLRRRRRTLTGLGRTINIQIVHGEDWPGGPKYSVEPLLDTGLPGYDRYEEVEDRERFYTKREALEYARDRKKYFKSQGDEVVIVDAP